MSLKVVHVNKERRILIEIDIGLTISLTSAGKASSITGNEPIKCYVNTQ